MRVRCYLPAEGWHREIIVLSGREAHHLLKVLRLTPGIAVTCFDGEGHEAIGVIQRVTGRDVILQLKDRRTIPLQPWEITLGVAVPRHGKLDQIVDQATQLGVAQIVPLSTERGVVKVSADGLVKKQSRWKQIAVESGKQSGVSRLPSIHSVTAWTSFVRSFQKYDLVLMATVQEPHEDLGDLFCRDAVRSILILIGPEGDFSPREVDEAVRQGANRVSLGPTVLRCETAVAAAIAIVNYCLCRKRTADS